MSEYVSMSHIIDRKSRFKVRLGNKNVFFYNILIFSFVLGKVFKRWELQIFKFRYTVTFSLTWPTSRRRRHKFFFCFLQDKFVILKRITIELNKTKVK